MNKLFLTLLIAGGIATAGSIRTIETSITDAVPNDPNAVTIPDAPAPTETPATPQQRVSVPQFRAQNLGAVVTAAAIATPEPAAYAITGLALVSLGVLRRRKR